MPPAPLELWGGHECTVNRVGQAFGDQTVRSGHEQRPGDLALFAELGLTALRYPVLWERVAPSDPDLQDWSWSDARLSELTRLNVRPIVGLLHHGGGPAYTGLLDPGFAEGLARHAGLTARRYPWVRDWTPVNEPLTTARFSALYGLWSPQLRDERACWEALLNQVDAVRLAMAEVRRVNPQARLIQTEDLGFTHATTALGDQARFENDRRWLSWDLLFGLVVHGHPLHQRLCDMGFRDRLCLIAAAPCPPDVIGINYYITSERWLDERLEGYPSHTHGGNGTVRYADVEAVRAEPCRLVGLAGLISSAWARYHVPIAVTECHIGCTEESRRLWLGQAWTACQAQRAAGVEIEALTAWSLLGAFDWNSLLTRQDGHYEAGVFELVAGQPRWTSVGRMLQAMTQSGHAPAVTATGWWERRERLRYAIRSAPCPVGAWD